MLYEVITKALPAASHKPMKPKKKVKPAAAPVREKSPAPSKAPISLEAVDGDEDVEDRLFERF